MHLTSFFMIFPWFLVQEAVYKQLPTRFPASDKMRKQKTIWSWIKTLPCYLWTISRKINIWTWTATNPHIFGPSMTLSCCASKNVKPYESKIRDSPSNLWVIGCWKRHTIIWVSLQTGCPKISWLIRNVPVKIAVLEVIYIPMMYMYTYVHNIISNSSFILLFKWP